MFIRSENLFIRPAWPEDRAALSRLEVPGRHDPLRAGELGHGLLVTMPGRSGARLIGTARLHPLRQHWEAHVWLAPAWRHLGLFVEAEDALAQLATSLPPPGDDGPRLELRPLIAA